MQINSGDNSGNAKTSGNNSGNAKTSELSYGYNNSDNALSLTAGTPLTPDQLTKLKPTLNPAQKLPKDGFTFSLKVKNGSDYKDATQFQSDTGLEFTAGTGAISGTPSKPFEHTYQITVTGTGNFSATHEIKIIAKPAPFTVKYKGSIIERGQTSRSPLSRHVDGANDGTEENPYAFQLVSGSSLFKFGPGDSAEPSLDGFDNSEANKGFNPVDAGTKVTYGPIEKKINRAWIPSRPGSGFSFNGETAIIYNETYGAIVRAAAFHSTVNKPNIIGGTANYRIKITSKSGIHNGAFYYVYLRITGY